MTHIPYFKQQSENLFKDYETKMPYIDDVDGNTYYRYEPKYFDVDSVFCDFNCDEKNFSLIEAQDIIAYMSGFDKWADLAKASEEELGFARLLFDNQDKISRDDWDMYIANVERDNNTTFDPESRAEILKHVFLKPSNNTEHRDNNLAHYDGDYVEYFKRQAKKFLKDYNVKAPYIDDILVEYRYDENGLSLMKAQHIIARMIGFAKWTDLRKASEAELELAKLLFDNRDVIPIQHWKRYISAMEHDHGLVLNAQSRLEIFKHDYEAAVGGGSFENSSNYRLNT